MAKDASMFSLSEAMQKNIYVVGEYSLSIVGYGDIPYRHGNIFNVYHVLILSENLLSVIPTYLDW